MKDRIPFGDEVSRDDAEVIQRMSGELHDEPGPRLDFDAMEARLLAKVEIEERLQAQRGRGWIVALGVAGAAAAAVFALRGTPAPKSTPVASTPAAVVAQPKVAHVDGAKSFSRPGFAAWTFDANASAEVDESSPDRITVKLERGSVRVEVVPGQAPEKFVVVAAGTRVAVRGTVFRVALADDVRVDVERGVVAVGPVDRPSGWTLTAPSGGSFARDASTGNVGALVPFSEVPVDGAAPVKPAASKPVVRGEALLELSAVRERVTGLAQTCFAKRLEGSTANVSFDTKLKLTSGARGVSLSFDPPLEPSVEQCVRDGAASLRAQAGTEEVSLTLVSRR